MTKFKRILASIMLRVGLNPIHIGVHYIPFQTFILKLEPGVGCFRDWVCLTGDSYALCSEVVSELFGIPELLTDYDRLSVQVYLHPVANSYKIELCSYGARLTNVSGALITSESYSLFRWAEEQLQILTKMYSGKDLYITMSVGAKT